MRPAIILFLSIIALFCHSSSAICQPKYEFRGVWVASVLNIDWPSKKGLSSDPQKAEFIRLLDMHKRNGMNAIIVQIRPAADALYPSPYEPWSEYLTGTQGQPPSPYYDPLKFMIEETHKRGMEFHAWLNPYRAVFNIHTSSISPTHVTRTHPDWFVTYNDQKIFDPGRPEAMQYVMNIVKDIITRYDIDGIVMDDYFYPYKIAGKEFHDERTYLKYGRGLNKDDWRRSNCDSLIEHIHQLIQTTTPLVKFGISPFGVWRNRSDDPDGSNTQAGSPSYDDQYANVLLWLKNGWIDYVSPQLYWEIGHHLCDYTTLLNWWATHNYGRHVYISHAFANDMHKKAWTNKKELPNEIKLLREKSTVQGSIFFSSKSFEDDPNGWVDSLRENYYRSPAIVPPMPWIDTTPPQRPHIIKVRDDVRSAAGNILKIDGAASDSVESEDVKSYVLYLSDSAATLGRTPTFIFTADSTRSFSFDVWSSQIPAIWNDCFMAVSSVDRENNESPLSTPVEFVKTKRGWVKKM